MKLSKINAEIISDMKKYINNLKNVLTKYIGIDIIKSTKGNLPLIYK